MNNLKLSTYHTKARWNGVEIDLPVNHELATYSKPLWNGDPAPTTHLAGLTHLPDYSMRWEGELPLYFEVTMDLPLNSSGELYYEKFGLAALGQLKVQGVFDGKLRVSYSAAASCSTQADECGLLELFRDQYPQMSEDDLEEKLYGTHRCVGVIEGATWVLHEIGQSVHLNDDNVWIQDSFRDEYGEELWSASMENVEKFSQELEADIFHEFKHAGKTYRLLLLGYQD